MGARDQRVDAYIAKAGDFAKPILTALREAVHKACPDVAETMKWSAPFFMRNGILCNMAAFKKHCAFGFWNRGVMEKRGQAMGHFGRLESIKDLPTQKVLIDAIKKAARFNESAASGRNPGIHSKNSRF